MLEESLRKEGRRSKRERVGLVREMEGGRKASDLRDIRREERKGGERGGGGKVGRAGRQGKDGWADERSMAVDAERERNLESHHWLVEPLVVVRGMDGG